jgi:hypothetical protein
MSQTDGSSGTNFSLARKWTMPHAACSAFFGQKATGFFTQFVVSIACEARYGMW